MKPTGTVTHFTLEIVKGHTELRAYGTRFEKGFTAIESIPSATPKPKTLATLRKHGASRAKHFKVQFLDQTL